MPDVLWYLTLGEMPRGVSCSELWGSFVAKITDKNVH